MSKSIRVIYGTEIDQVVDGDSKPADIIAALTPTYKELADSEFTLKDEGDYNVMRITLKQGRKA